jgi:hypothetical protein
MSKALWIRLLDTWPKFLDTLHTCSYAKPIKSAPMAPALRLCNWLRACGIPARSAPKSALSSIVAMLLMPAQWPKLKTTCARLQFASKARILKR